MMCLVNMYISRTGELVNVTGEAGTGTPNLPKFRMSTAYIFMFSLLCQNSLSPAQGVIQK